MGQYHIPLSIDRREFFMPHGLGDGLKALEQAFSEPGGVATALHALLTSSNGRGGGDYGTEHHLSGEILGRWAGTRVAIVGDYSEEGDIPASGGVEPILYDLCMTDSLDGMIRDLEERANEAAESESGSLYGVTSEGFTHQARLAEELGVFTDITVKVREYMQGGVDDYYHAFTYDGDGWMDRKFDLVRRHGK